MAMRESDRERTPEFSYSVIFTTSDIVSGDTEVLILLFIRALLSCVMVLFMCNLSLEEDCDANIL